jgi:hypothetical protein
MELEAVTSPRYERRQGCRQKWAVYEMYSVMGGSRASIEARRSINVAKITLGSCFVYVRVDGNLACVRPRLS